jgi:hypothetical protein
VVVVGQAKAPTSPQTANLEISGMMNLAADTGALLTTKTFSQHYQVSPANQKLIS